MADEIKKDELTGTETTGHEWDGIQELDTPMPRWWLLTFYITIIWSVVYWVLYPSWPLLTTSTEGILGHSSRKAVIEDIARHKASQSGFIKRMSEMSLEEIKADKALYDFAVKGGRSAYLVNCSQCHGSGASGSAGYPNLNDDDWLWGGKLEDIHTTIAHGIRFDKDDDTRTSQMPNYLEDEILKKEQIADIVEHVLAMGNRKHDADAAKRGVSAYQENCVSCHGEAGEGNREQGAPKLTDAIALFGHKRADLISQVSAPKHGVMPAWGHRLDAVTIKQLTLYVHSLGGGE